MAVKMKIRSQRGATLMAALLFFLVAAVCGSIILAAATATLSRMTTQAEDARAYYSLTSAAQLMRDDLLQSRWQVTVTLPESGDATYTLTALSVDGDADTKTFVPDLLMKTGGSADSIFKVVTTMTIEAKGTAADAAPLPTVYAIPKDAILFQDLFNDYQSGSSTKLVFYITNDNERIESKQFRNTFTEDGNTRQAYWLELSLDSVKIPSGYVDNRDNNIGTVTFEIKWDNATIRKLDNSSLQTS